MELSNQVLSVVDNVVDCCQNPSQNHPCRAPQYFLCPHCQFHVCFEHGQQHQEQVQNDAIFLYNQAKILENTLIEYRPVQIVIEEVFHSLNEWKTKMYNFIDQYCEQIKMYVEQAQNRLNEQWAVVKQEYLQMLQDTIAEPIDQLLKVPQQIHPDQTRQIHARLINVRSQITNLLTFRDLIRINFDSCSLSGDINISRGHFPSPMINRWTSSSMTPSDFLENIPQLDRIKLLYRLDMVPADTSALAVSSYQEENPTPMVVTWIKPSTLAVFHVEQGMMQYIDVEPSFTIVNDIVWCDYLNLFLLCGAALYTFDVINQNVKQLLTYSSMQIWSITTYQANLFLCYMMGESSLIEHRSLSSLHTIQRYTRSQILPTGSPSIIEVARCIRTNGQHIAMTVRNLTTYEWRVDIFDFHMQRLFKGDNIGCSTKPDNWCCLLTSCRTNFWLVINNTTQHETLTLIDRQARIRQQIRCEGYNICAFKEAQRFVIKDRRGLAIFHF